MARRAYIDVARCDGYEGCPAMQICPTKSFLREENDEPWFIGPTCLGCGRCVMACDRQAIRLV
ncbi:MAG: hypothetical protein IMW95_09755 [Moorella humiferrea]|nr:hypothetical protein [Moorella humiferrea]